MRQALERDELIPYEVQCWHQPMYNDANQNQEIARGACAGLCQVLSRRLQPIGINWESSLKRQCQSANLKEVPSCEQCPLGDASLFSVLPADKLLDIQKHVEKFDIERGETLYSYGSKSEYIYTIRKGMIKLVQYLPEGSQRIVRLLQDADIVGIEATVETHYEHDAVALEPTELCRYPVSSVRELSRTDDGLHRDLMGRWHRALHEADEFVTQLSTGSAKQRVARLLLKLSGSDENTSFTLYSREDLGAILGVTTETTSRVIAEFKRQGLLIEVAGHASRFLCDRPNLDRIASN